MTHITYGANFKVKGKTDPQNLSYSGAWQTTKGSFTDLSNHISKGHPWMPAVLDGNGKRWQTNANYAEVIALDHDNGCKVKGENIYEPRLSIAQALAHPFISAHAGLVIESASSKPEWHKFRTVYRLPCPVKDWQTIRICNRYLAHLVGDADPACKDASRFFFGAPGRQPLLLNETATLPAAFIKDAIAWHQGIEAEEKRRAEKARQEYEEWKAKNPDNGSEALIRSALAAIDPDCDYSIWIAIGIALLSMGDDWFEVWDSWSAGGSSYEPGGCDRKWQTFPDKAPEPHVIFGIAKRYGWQYPQQQPNSSQSSNSESWVPTSNNIAQGKSMRLSLEQVKQELKKLIDEGLNQSDIEIRVADLAKASDHQPLTIWKIFNSLQNENELKTEAKGAAANLRQLKVIKRQRLDIEALLHGDGGKLAAMLHQTADAMPTAPEYIFATLIAVMATFMGTKHTLVLNATAGYVARAIFRVIIAAPTGCKKTPAQSAVLNPVFELEKLAATEYEYELATYEQEHRKWLKDSKSGDANPEPRKPKRRRYISSDSTLAARIQIHSENPTGLLLYKDEASAFSTERGRFNSGKGDGGELEADLSEFNGGPIMCDRKGDGNTFLAKTAISRVGATQLVTLQKLMGNHEDGQGEWSRWLICAADAPPSKIDLSKDVGDIGLASNLMDFFKNLEKMPEMSFILTPAAKLSFQAYQGELTDRLIAEDHLCLQAAYPKFETYFGRFIVLLHVANAALAGRAPEPVVDAHNVELARQLTEYFIGQLKLVLALNSPQQKLTGDLLKTYQYLERKQQPLEVRQVVQARIFSGEKGKTQYIREMLNTLVEHGLITQQENLFVLNKPNNTETVEYSTQKKLNVEQDVEYLLSRDEATQQLTQQGFQDFSAQNVEQLSRSSNKREIHENELTQFLKLYDDQPKDYQRKLAELTQEQTHYLYEQLPELNPAREVHYA